jgi:hypothetical protein
MTAPTPTDVWTESDFPVLRAVAAWYTQDQHTPLMFIADVLDALVWAAENEDRAGWAVDRLAKGELIEVTDITSGKLYPEAISGVTTEGLRITGAWPSEASVRDALQDVLDQLAERDDATPEEASKLRDVAGIVGRVALSVGTDFASRLAAHAAGLP